MLAKQYRLLASTRLSNPQNISTPFFRIAVKENTLGHNRFGFVVSKKIDKRAVVRNRLKRVLREIAGQYVRGEKGQDVLFIVTKNFFTVPTQEVHEVIVDAFKNLHIQL